MRWNIGRHIRNANVLRHTVRGLVNRFRPASGGDASSPKPPPVQKTKVVPTSTPKSRVQAVTGGKKVRNAFGRKKLAAKLVKMRGTPAGRSQLRSQVKRQRV